jgi:hypothetical protein
MQYGLPMMLVFNNLSGLLMVVVIPMQCGQWCLYLIIFLYY